jgi:hypothetical protein
MLLQHWRLYIAEFIEAQGPEVLALHCITLDVVQECSREACGRTLGVGMRTGPERIVAGIEVGSIGLVAPLFLSSLQSFKEKV